MNEIDPITSAVLAMAATVVAALIWQLKGAGAALDKEREYQMKEREDYKSVISGFKIFMEGEINSRREVSRVQAAALSAIADESRAQTKVLNDIHNGIIKQSEAQKAFHEEARPVIAGEVCRFQEKKL